MIYESESDMKKLYRSTTSRKIAGVCGGIGEMMEIDPTLVRLVVVILMFATAIIPFLLGYLVAWWIVPEGSQGISSTTIK